MKRDLQFAIRMLLKQPGFSFIAVLTLALGIGVTSAVFSLIQGVLLTPPPYKSPQQLMLVQSARTDGQKEVNPRAWPSCLQAIRPSVFRRLENHVQACAVCRCHRETRPHGISSRSKMGVGGQPNTRRAQSWRATSAITIVPPEELIPMRYPANLRMATQPLIQLPTQRK